MPGDNRKSGIGIRGEIPWGTHLCQFYQTREDLLDILVPYFKAGLEKNEFCMWVTAEPLNEKEAEEALRKAVPHFDRYKKRGQIEIVPHSEWYLRDGVFRLGRVLKDWIDRLDQALSKGYDGMRVTGNTAWLEKKDWGNFTDYEKELNRVIGNYRMLAICSYSLEKCCASDVVAVVSNHQFSLIRRSGNWEIIESAERKLLKDRIAKYFKENRALLRAIPDLIFVLDRDGTYLEYKIPNSNIPHLSSDQFVGKNIMETFPEEVAESCLKLIKDTLQTMDIQTLDFQLTIDNKPRHFEARFIPFTEEAVLSLIRDISERKKIEKQIQTSLKEKEILLGEIHHRVKNNLQVISSLINLKSRKIKGRESKLVLKECSNFVDTMVEIHENFYSSGNLARISLKEFILAVTRDLVGIYHPDKPDKVTLRFDLEDVALGIDSAIPLGLAFNELVTNSLKHAFPRGKKGEIRVSLHAREGNQIELVVGDNGIGFPKGLDIHKTESFGFNLITGLVEKQLQGKIELSGTAGTEFRITLQEEKD